MQKPLYSVLAEMMVPSAVATPFQKLADCDMRFECRASQYIRQDDLQRSTAIPSSPLTLLEAHSAVAACFRNLANGHITWVLSYERGHSALLMRILNRLSSSSKTHWYNELATPYAAHH